MKTVPNLRVYLKDIHWSKQNIKRDEYFSFEYLLSQEDDSFISSKFNIFKGP